MVEPSRTAEHPAARVPDVLFDDPAAEARWRARFSAVRIGLPTPARDRADRAVYVSNESGSYELYTWDVLSGSRLQATARSDGTTEGELDPTGEQLWWFDDEDGDEFGSWRRQPFGDSPPPTSHAVQALGDVPPGYATGLALGRSVVVAGLSDDDGVRVHLGPPDGPFRVVYRHAEDATVGPLSADETLWVLAHSEGGDSRYPDLRVFSVGNPVGHEPAGDEPVGDLSDGPERALHPLAFSPVPGDQRLLVGHERRGRDELLLWDPTSGSVEEVDLGLPGDLDGDFYPDGQALLILRTHAGRTTMHRLDLSTGRARPLPAAPGVISGAVTRPDGAVWYRHSSAADQASLRCLTVASNPAGAVGTVGTAGALGTGGEAATAGTDTVLLNPSGRPAPRSEPLTDVWVPGPGGPVHALLARPQQSPASSGGPLAALFFLHGGPAAADDDSYNSVRAAWLDAGFVVVHVNYRGSTGYGSAWRDALTDRIGHIELQDVTAVHDHLIADGVVDPLRSVLLGYSWGGFLTLLGIGTDPDRWAAAVAGAPVADYVAAYEDEMEPLRAYDRGLFGGSPDEVPDRYHESSPLTYVDAVRTPVLVSAGENDPRTPIRQVDNYLERLAAGGARYEVYRYDAGHGSGVVAERIRQVAVEIDFVRRTLAERR